MIGYTTIGVSNMESACKFYAELLAELGCKQLFGMDRIKFFKRSTLKLMRGPNIRSIGYIT